jgi:hypothetical protein
VPKFLTIRPFHYQFYTMNELNRQRTDVAGAVQLETVAASDPESYEASICRGIALSLRGRGKESLEEMERVISRSPEEGDAYFWRGRLSAYSSQGRPHSEEVVTAIEQALSRELPPVLLMPLYWLEKDRPAVFVKYVKPLLLRYGI